MKKQNKILKERITELENKIFTLKDVFNLDDVSVYTGLSKSHLYKLTCTGGMPCYKPNGKYMYFSKAEIDKWLLRNRKATTTEIEEQASNFITLNK